VYSLIRPLLFTLDPERVHDLTFTLLRAPLTACLLRGAWGARVPALPVEVMGLHFPNPLGLAAGLDKNATAVGPLAAMGFGFLELGTVTPRPQPGNPRPRLFRLPHAAAIINRMGFNSAGLDAFLANLARAPRTVPLGINLGKNKDTPAERTLDDYLTGLRAVYAHADYVTINISSPNTPGLRALQEEAALADLLAGLKAEQARLAVQHGRHVPIALKIAPDLDEAALERIARLLLEHRLEAVIATNTTITRPGVEHEPLAGEAGGLSGRPLKILATQAVRRLYATLQGHIPIIGVGGIETADDAWEKLVAGADLVQVYAAFIYRGPGLVRDLVAGLAEKTREYGAATLAGAVAQARHAHR
jgi:dihydroorotate dehydrogenase